MCTAKHSRKEKQENTWKTTGKNRAVTPLRAGVPEILDGAGIFSNRINAAGQKEKQTVIKNETNNAGVGEGTVQVLGLMGEGGGGGASADRRNERMV